MRRIVLVCAVALVVAALGAPASAHTDLSSSDPAADTTVSDPLDEITLTFSRPIELAGAGVEILDADGAVVEAAATVDDEVVTVRPEQPLDDGRYGVRWAVRSADAHPVRGAYAFTVEASPHGTAAVGGPAAPEPAADGASSPRSESDRSSAHAPSGGAGTAPNPLFSTDGATSPGTATGLDASLTADPTLGIRRVDQVLRAVFYALALAIVGSVIFLVGVWQGTRREARHLTRLVSRLAGVTIVVVLAQVLVRSARTAGGWSEALAAIPSTATGAFAVGMTMRAVGAVAVLAGLGALRRTLCATATVAPIAGGAVDVLEPTPVAPAVPPSAWDRLRAAPTTALGVASLVGSFALVGHAGTTEPRVVAVAAIVAHVAAAAMWAGGLSALVATLVARRRARAPLQAGLLTTRFSVVAAVGVALASVAGTALAVVRLDSVAALWSTAYGWTLLAKLVVVGVVGAVGAYNHYVVVPMLRAHPDHPVGHRLRRLGILEVGLLLVVVGLTSVLVGLAR